jgi:hypothetical protein
MRYYLVIICTVLILFSSTSAQVSDNFNDGNANGWVCLPTPNISNFTFVSTQNEFAIWVSPGPITGNFTFEADARILTRYNDIGGADHISLAVHVPFNPSTGQLTSSNYYTFTTRQGSINDVYIYNQGNLHGQTSYYLNPPQSTHRFKITKSGSTYTCYIDNVQVTSYTFTSPLSGGYVALYGAQGYSGSGTQPAIEWDNVTANWSGIVSVEMAEGLPSSFFISQNYPNPFNPETKIDFSLPRASFVSLNIYNTLGEKVAELVSENLQAGNYQANWNATSFASGVYLYRFVADNFVQTKNLLLLK